MIHVEQLSKRYAGRTVVQIPQWTVQPGEIVGLVGSNGAGKTTLMRMMLDLIEPDTGRVHLHGVDVSKDTSWKAFTGSYLDTGFLIGFLTTEEYLDFVGSVHGMNRAESRRAAAPFDGFLPESGDRSGRYLRELSTGNAKKVGIAAALLTAPRLLLLDEPFANLDPPSQIRLKKLLRTLHAEHGTTMVISSHDLGHVTDLCGRITLLNEGTIVRDGATADETLAELEQYFTR